MPEPEVYGFDGSTDRRPFVAKGHVDIVALADGTVGRATCEPGWRWSAHVGPIAGTDLCRVNHVGYVISGSLRWKMEDGAELETSAGEAFSIPAGHDAWVIGDEDCVFLDFAGMERYAL